jgi:hypothetical protein
MAPDALQKLEELKGRFLPRTEVPAKDSWQALDDAAIWKRIVTEVMAVGASWPVEDRFLKSPTLQDRISYPSLEPLKGTELLQAINGTLTEAGIRYASSDSRTCRKTNALAHNLEVVRKQGGPRAFVEAIVALAGDQEKIAYVRKNLGYFGSKCARDWLMGLGLVEQALALDTRVTAILLAVGVEIDQRSKSSEKVYAREEQRLLSELCGPLGMRGVEFDRMLYQNYQQIRAELSVPRRGRQAASKASDQARAADESGAPRPGPSGEQATALNPETVGNVGLYYVCYRLALRGWNVMPTSRNARGVDLMAYSQDGSRKLTVQVKALSARNAVPLGTNVANLTADYFVVCRYVRREKPDCFVLTLEEVRRLAHPSGKDKVSYWLEAAQYEAPAFLENWDKLGVVPT